MTRTLGRSICESIMDALADTPVVVLNGARQVGKTTLVCKLPFSTSHEFVTLDDTINREAAQRDPRTFINRSVGTLIIDEVQPEPGRLRRQHRLAHA